MVVGDLVQWQDNKSPTTSRLGGHCQELGVDRAEGGVAGKFGYTDAVIALLPLPRRAEDVAELGRSHLPVGHGCCPVVTQFKSELL